ncbi:13494_t:CDS:2, partial [Gigaspora rosea]
MSTKYWSICAYPLTDDLAKSFGYENIKKLQTIFIHIKIFTPMKNGTKHIKGLIGSLIDNESNKQECFKIVRSFIKDYYDMKNNVVEMDYAFENKIYEITSIKNPQEIGKCESRLDDSRIFLTQNAYLSLQLYVLA